MSYTLSTEELDRFRAMKEECAKDAPTRGTDDMNGYIELWRDGAPVFAVMTEVNRDKVLDAIHFGVPAIEADRVVAVMDAHLSHRMENPTTGKPWEPGEMQKACHEDKLCSTDVITDCLIVNDARRDGSYEMRSLMYHVDERAKDAGNQPIAVHWQRDKDTHYTAGSEDTLDGLVPDVIRDSFNQDMSAHLPEDVLAATQEMSPTEVRAAKDAAAAGRLVMGGYGVALMGSDEEWFRIVSDLLRALSESIGSFSVTTSLDDQED